MSVTAAKGFVASGVHCGIRKKERLDLSLVRSLVPATGAGMFTINRMLAAPVILSREHLELAQPQAVVTNSGVANAATGERGLLDARATAAETARLLGLDTEEVLVLSTGVIGSQLPSVAGIPCRVVWNANPEARRVSQIDSFSNTATIFIPFISPS